MDHAETPKSHNSTPRVDMTNLRTNDSQVAISASILNRLVDLAIRTGRSEALTEMASNRNADASRILEWFINEVARMETLSNTHVVSGEMYRRLRTLLITAKTVRKLHNEIDTGKAALENENLTHYLTALDALNDAIDAFPVSEEVFGTIAETLNYMYGHAIEENPLIGDAAFYAKGML